MESNSGSFITQQSLQTLRIHFTHGRRSNTLPQEGAKTSHFRSMKINVAVRKYAEEQKASEQEALAKSMKEKSREIREKDAEM